MYNDEYEHFSFLDLFNEAEDDDNTGADAGDADNTSGNDGDTTDGGDSEGETSDEDSNDDGGGDEEDDGNDEFDIDTSVDDDGDDNNDDSSSDTSSSSSSSSGDGSSSSMGEGEDEPNPVNTTLFDSLTPEEQAVKIKELKRLYREMFTSVNDILNRIQKSNIDEDTLDYTNKLTSDLYDFKTSLMDYFVYQFNIKSYPENDMKYNEFLYYLNSFKDVYEELASSREKKLGKKSTKS